MSWYKPKILSSSITSHDFENCASLTRRQKSVDVLTNNSCRSDIEIFSSCKATSITLRIPDSGKGIRLILNTSHDFGLKKVTGLGLERRDFSTDRKRTKNMAEWGEATKRLEFELHTIHNSCEYNLNGLTYIIQAYHMWNLGHFYESIFRLVLELKNRGDYMDVKQIMILNAAKEVHFLALLEQLFPNVHIVSPSHFSRKKS